MMSILNERMNREGSIKVLMASAKKHFENHKESWLQFPTHGSRTKPGICQI